jgi:sec-independent protein translocase protein TatC
MGDTNSRKNKKRNPEKEMTFWEHLEELRWHLLRIIIVTLALAIVAFANRSFIFDHVLLAPRNADFITNRLLCKLADFLNIKALCLDNFSLQIVNIDMSGQFTTHLYVSVIAAVVVAIPYIIWEIWSFIRPALMPKEKKYSRGAVVVSSFLFLLGMLFSYFLLFPWALNFFGTYQVSEAVKNTITLSSYISTFVSTTLGSGIVFELPVFVYFFTKVGLLTPSFLRRNRKYTFIILLTVAAIITPPDVFSQLIATLPLVGLYEVSILVSSRVYKKIQAAEKLAG